MASGDYLTPRTARHTAELMALPSHAAPAGNPGGRCLALTGDDGVRMLGLPDGALRIGRSRTSDVELDDPTVSRRHAMIVAGAGGVEIRDEGSTGGTWVNGRRVQRARLEHGDAVRIGRTVLCFVDGSGPPTVLAG